MKTLIKSTVLGGLSAAFTASSAMGAFTFTNGDLILGFRATSGVGSTKNVFFNIGSGIYHRDNGSPNSPDVRGNISTTLTTVFGSNWYTRNDIRFGVVGNLNTSSPGSPTFTPAVSGDPSRTFYVSTPTVAPGLGAYYGASTFVSAALGSAGNKFSGTETMVVGLTDEADGSAILDQGTQPTEWNNGWTTWTNSGFAYDTFADIEQTFGQSGASTYVDIQRVLATNTGASPSGVVGGGTYTTTLAIGSNGSVYMIPEPSTSVLAGLAGLALTLRRRRA